MAQSHLHTYILYNLFIPCVWVESFPLTWGKQILPRAKRSSQLHNAKLTKNRNFTFDVRIGLGNPVPADNNENMVHHIRMPVIRAVSLAGRLCCCWISPVFFLQSLLWLISRLLSPAAPQIFRILQMDFCIFAFSIAQTGGLVASTSISTSHALLSSWLDDKPRISRPGRKLFIWLWM